MKGIDFSSQFTILVASSKKGRPKKAEQSEVSRLRAENAKLKEDIDILKKAAKYFMREQP